MGVIDAIDITAAQRKTLLSLLRRYLPGVAVWAFGSRVKWTSRPDSDLDLVVFSKQEQSGRISLLKEALEESSLPFRVDLLVWDDIPESFQQNIRKEYAVLVDESKETAVPPAPTFRQMTFQQLMDDGLLEIGDGYRAQNSELGGGGPIFLRAGHVTDSHIDFSGVEHFHAHLAGKVESKLSREGDTVITTKGNSTGRTAFVSESMPPFVYSPHLSYWRSRSPNKLYGGFLRYWARGAEFQHQLSSMKVSTDMAPYLSLTDQRRLTITLLPINQQKSIAHILGTLDDKIELNRRMNATLEATARAIFKSWFVDFDPVRAKAAGRVPVGMTPEVAALFPEGFEDSELGEIPRGWRVGCLGDICTLKRGHDLPTSTRTAGAIPVISSSGISGLHSEAKARAPGVVTGRYGTIGKVFFVESDYWPLNTTLYVEDFKASPPRFIFHVLERVDYSVYTDKAAVPGVNRNHLHEEPCVIPPLDVRNAFAHMLAPVWLQHAANVFQSRTLATLRDALLPKLLSGEIRVGDAENMLMETIAC